MADAGAFRFPSRDLDDCLSYLRRARDRLRSRSTTREAFARAIDQSPKGGGFGKLVGSMVAYGLVETGRGKIATTDLCEEILFGSPTEQKKGKEESVKNVRLFNEVIAKYGPAPRDEQLRAFLGEEAGVEISEAREIAEEVGKLLRRNSASIPSIDCSLQLGSDVRDDVTGPLLARLEMQDYGILNIRDEISMDMAINLLTQVKRNRGWGGDSKPRESPTRSRPPKGPPRESPQRNKQPQPQKPVPGAPGTRIGGPGIEADTSQRGQAGRRKPKPDLSTAS